MSVTTQKKHVFLFGGVKFEKKKKQKERSCVNV